MHALRQPLLFAPVYKDYIWGGNRIAAHYGRSGTPPVCAESWELSAHADGPSIVCAGPLTGQSLAELAQTHDRALLGTRAPHPNRFPLLFKLIDARQKLSVQVHPSEQTAAACGGEPKTEMWYVLERTPGAELYAGLQPGTNADVLRAALAARQVAGRLVRLPVNPDDALFIPGGLVHAIGDGCLLYEVQQNSNTTYRLHDWDRFGPDGQPRPLHVERAFAVIDWALPVPVLRRPQPAASNGPNAWFDVLDCSFFHMRRVLLTAPEAVPQDGSSFHALFVIAGCVTVAAGGMATDWPAGTSGLVPAAAGGYRVEPVGGAAAVLLTTL
jgi:mannose-6-phosphate isomerase